MTDQSEPNPGGPEPRLERLLTAALATRPPSEEALQRLHAAVEPEWRGATAERTPGSGRRRPSGRSRWLALVAAAGLAGLGLALWVVWPQSPGAAIGSVSRLQHGLAVRSGLWHQRRLRNGDPLRVGDRLTSTGPVLVALNRGGTVRIAAGSSIEVTAAASLSLGRGLIYVDIPSESGTTPPLRVSTPAGAIEHVGTEFELKSDGQSVRVRVREGRIRFLGEGAPLLADAGTELLATPGKAPAAGSIDVYGGDWLWAAALAPDYEIEGMPLIGFLQWVSRELGRSLDFADVNTRQIADRTILHGSISHQAPIDAIANVLATTSLTYELRGSTLWVRSGTSAVL
jgi:ferric-dicitrate binding protein FerR (iron transport regulator)